jgi:hypothetical protein
MSNGSALTLCLVAFAIGCLSPFIGGPGDWMPYIALGVSALLTMLATPSALRP